ncbi:PQQ-like beta-propeller repeat protein [bacterium]|nr:PQQ-like beta-propeller repeat protein [bacterium]
MTGKFYCRGISILIICMAFVPAFSQEWLQWGGSSGDFKIDSQKLNSKWPEEGPLKLWHRTLGEGYSSILFKQGRLYTMTSNGNEEIIISLDAKTGRTIWEHSYLRKFWPDMRMAFGPGPNATPIIVDNKIIAIGISGQMRCLNLSNGELIWKRHLPSEYGRRGRMEEYGYSASPIRYKNSIIVQVGGHDHAVIAINPDDGSTLWASSPGGVSYAQSSIIHLAGMDQYLYFSPEGLNALDPANGSLCWHHNIPVDNGNHLTPVVQCDANHIFVSSQFDSGGGRLLKIESIKNVMSVEELWFDSDLKASCWTDVCIGDYIYGSSGGHNFSFLTAFNWHTGKVAWKKRGHRMAQCLFADKKLIFLDQSGTLGIATISPKGINILDTAKVAGSVAWTLPTLISSTLYVRDRNNIMALAL